MGLQNDIKHTIWQCIYNNYEDATLDNMINIYKYFKTNKGMKYTIEYIDTLLEISSHQPNYPKAVEEFFLSDYFSYIIKDILKDQINKEESKELLEKDILFNDYTSKELSIISRGIHKSNVRANNGDIIDFNKLLTNYLFLLDGEGPTEYIKSKYDRRTLAKELLEHTGLYAIPMYYSGCGVNRKHFSEEHIFSLYKKFIKYFPDKKEIYIELVNKVPGLAPSNFVSSYLKFIYNKFEIDFEQKNSYNKDDETSSNRTYKTVSLSEKNLHKKDSTELDWDTHFDILNNFLEMIEEKVKQK